MASKKSNNVNLEEDCIIEKQELDEIRKEHKRLKEIYDECKKKKYNKDYYKQLNLKDLLKIIKKENKSKVIELLELFPFIGFKSVITTRNTVFEALWYIIFILNYDELRPNNYKRILKKSLEGDEANNDNLKTILTTTNVNESHKSGIADIYFVDKIREEFIGSQSNIISCKNPHKKRQFNSPLSKALCD